MNILNVRNLTLFPYGKKDSAIYKKIYRISSIRLKISGLLKPKNLFLCINTLRIDDVDISYNSNPESNDETVANIWFRIPPKFTGIIELGIYGKILGLYFNLYKEHFLIESDSPNTCELNSDRYLDHLIGDSNQDVVNTLEESISALPSTIRSSVNDRSVECVIKSIGLMRLDQLGDFILTIPSIIEIHELWPSAELTLFISPSNEGAARDLKFIRNIIVIPFSFQEKSNTRILSNDAYLKVSEYCSNTTFDIFIDLSPMPETRDLLGVVNSRFKCGFENVFCPYLDLGIQLHSIDPCNALSNITHAVSPGLLVDAVRLIFKPNPIHLNLSTDKTSYLEEFGLKNSQYCVIHGGSRNILIRWPIEYYVDLTLKIKDQFDHIVFISDDEIDYELKSVLVLNPNIIIVENGLDYENFDALISYCQIFVGNDTGPKHLAALRGVPVISLHSARTNWSEWGQIDSGKIISRRVPCSGCAITEYKDCGRDLVCIRDIKVSEVEIVIHNMLKKND